MKHKKFQVYSTLLCAVALASCAGGSGAYFTDDLPIRLDLTEDKLTILQLTDLHLTFGFDYNDRRTYRLVEALVEEVEPDLVVFTGDMSMSPHGPALFNKLAKLMKKLDVYWTFIFGNHDNDTQPYSRYFDTMIENDKMLFKAGPSMVDGGYGNFKIETYYQDQPFYHLYLLDSHTEAEDPYEYSWLSEAQVQWYKDKVVVDQTNTVHSSVFMHIPLMQYLQYENYPLADGAQGEGIYHQGVDTGFFQAMVDYGMSDAVFVGHDHLNTFSFFYQGVRLAYGVASGYNGYGNIPKGGRVIEIDANQNLTTYLLTDAEVGV